MANLMSRSTGCVVSPDTASHAAVGIDAFLFDVDGVLADTADLHAEAWRRAAREIGIEIPDAIIPLLRGRSREDSLRLILQGRALPGEVFASVMDRKNRYYVVSLDGLTPDDALPGAAKLLDELSRARLRLAAVSASRNARLVLTRIGLIRKFERVVDGLVKLPSGEGNRYAYAAAAMRCEPTRCVVVEDSQAGVDLARAAGMGVIGLGDAVRNSKAHFLLDRLDSIRACDLLSAFRAVATKRAAVLM